MQTKTEYKTKMVLIWVLRVPLYGVVTSFEAHKKVCWSYKCMARRLDDHILLWAGFIPDIIMLFSLHLLKYTEQKLLKQESYSKNNDSNVP